MRELSAWAQTGGATGECAARVKEFQKFLGRAGRLPLVQLAPDPLRQRLSALLPGQARVRRGGARPPGVGRVRDALHQRPAVGHARPGREDFEFTRGALPAATKDEQGKPYIEMLREQGVRRQPGATGGHVPDYRALAEARSARRCCGSSSECGVKGVYMDQIAAAEPDALFRLARTATPGRRPLVDRGLLGACGVDPQGQAGQTACSPPSATPSPTRRSSTAT